MNTLAFSGGHSGAAIFLLIFLILIVVCAVVGKSSTNVNVRGPRKVKRIRHSEDEEEEV